MNHSKIPGHFEEEFKRTYGHKIREGNLQKQLNQVLNQ
jgi:hypothetical protein